MDIAIVRDRIAQPFSHLLLEKAQDAPDFLKRKSFAAQFGDNGDFHHFLGQINAPMPLLAGRNDVSFIPPLQLAKTHACDARNVAAGVAVLFGRRNGQVFSCFEHFAMPLCSRSSLNFTRFQAPKNALAGTHVNIKIRSHPEVLVPSNLTRKELLKQDKFTVEAEHTVNFLSEHRKEAVRYGVIALVVIVVAAGAYYYRSSQVSVREQILGEAISLSAAPVGQPAQGGGPSFPTQAAKSDAVAKAFTKLAADYSGTQEGYIAEYYLAT